MTKKILVVDDDPGYLELLSQILSDKGFSVFTALNGSEALKVLAQERADLVITDMRMPVMDGLETVISIRERRGEDTPIILMTAFSAEDRVRKVLEFQGTTYLKKPFELDHLMETVDRVISLS